ncbi:hypothetical protein BSKO_00825 [Bryopsis sp. KO-2023]|nr:hypothetical protein BSKO_00825 [Bryopsis sp. KO-2023]
MSVGDDEHVNFFNPEWRRKKLLEIKKAKSAKQKELSVNLDVINTLIMGLKRSTEPQIELQYYNKHDAEAIKNLGIRHGLFSEMYGSGKLRTVVVSKSELPVYLSKYDPKSPEEDWVEMSEETRDAVQNALNVMSNPYTRHLYSGSRSEYSYVDSVVETETSEYRPMLLDPVEAARENARLKQCQESQQRRPAVQELARFRQKLPTHKARRELLQKISTNPVLVISGETGCGKTTQLPQYILESEISDGRGYTCSIICTQPRRISAISVAQRVSQERGERVGETVGYQIRLECEKSQDTRLLFCTTGVLLRRLINDPLLQDVSHVIVDEIHERGMNEDFLLIILKDLIQKRNDLRLVLMSATMNAELFASYFHGAPTMHIPGFTYPVEDLHLEDILIKTGISLPCPIGIKNLEPGAATGGYVPEESEAKGNSTVFDSLRAWTLPGNFGANVELIVQVISWICQHEAPGAILVFVPGFQAIVNIKKQLDELPSMGSARVLPIHSQLPTASQKEIFNKPPEGIRKVVLATNIAETSITIDDIVYVVDCGTSNQTSYDSVNKLKCITPQFISKAQAHQRRGRAGRVQAGKCYRLFPRRMHDNFFQEHLAPEILRTPLEELVLSIKSLRLGSVKQFLQKAINPPDLRSIDNALGLLEGIGAVNGDEQLTALGHHLAMLPVDPCVGKMIIMGAIFGCLDPILTIAAGLGYKDPFILSLDKRDQANAARRRFACQTLSDHIAIANAFKEYLEARKERVHWEFCRYHFLSFQTVKLMEDMRTQFAENLAEQGFLDIKQWRKRNEDGPPPQDYFDELESEIARLSQHQDNVELIRAVLVAGMYPNVATVVQNKKVWNFKTLDDGKVSLYPSSVLYREKSFPHKWLVYSEKIKTKDVSLTGASLVTNYALLFFGGELKLEPGAPGVSKLSMMNGNYTFRTDIVAAELIQNLRQELHGVLKRKIEDPGLDMVEAGGPVVQAVRELLENENRDAQPMGLGEVGQGRASGSRGQNPHYGS